MWFALPFVRHRIKYAHTCGVGICVVRVVRVAFVSCRQVDLPGYGHAVATRHAIKGWLRMIKEYITTRQELIRYVSYASLT